uniref:Uncharacterized protein n=1 Tax=Spongospora subterranea TaxID=70186 RepID=A0A0H5R8D0_9EUKA|eukprot:CRZ09962.1 hypothetical protein [Spongospora subterranea]
MVIVSATVLVACMAGSVLASAGAWRLGQIFVDRWEVRWGLKRPTNADFGPWNEYDQYLWDVAMAATKPVPPVLSTDKDPEFVECGWCKLPGSRHTMFPLRRFHRNISQRPLAELPALECHTMPEDLGTQMLNCSEPVMLGPS